MFRNLSFERKNERKNGIFFSLTSTGIRMIAQVTWLNCLNYVLGWIPPKERLLNIALFILKKGVKRSEKADIRTIYYLPFKEVVIINCKDRIQRGQVEKFNIVCLMHRRESEYNPAATSTIAKPWSNPSTKLSKLLSKGIFS